jgi:hypothetical protein
MKNNLLTEISHIKKLMGLLESSDEECESQLEDKGYVVYSPNEQIGKVEACEGKKLIKCVKEWMKSNGVDDELITIDSHKSVCYLMVQSIKKIKLGSVETNDVTWLFWQNGDLSYIDTFSKIQIPDPASGEKYGQYHYQGNFECDGSDLKAINFKYLGVYEVDKYDKLIKDKKFKTDSGLEIDKASNNNFTFDMSKLKI